MQTQIHYPRNFRKTFKHDHTCKSFVQPVLHRDELSYSPRSDNDTALARQTRNRGGLGRVHEKKRKHRELHRRTAQLKSRRRAFSFGADNYSAWESTTHSPEMKKSRAATICHFPYMRRDRLADFYFTTQCFFFIFVRLVVESDMMRDLWWDREHFQTFGVTLWKKSSFSIETNYACFEWFRWRMEI